MTTLSELSKNLEDAEIFESSDDDVNGAVNCAILLDDCIIVGVDSRGTKYEKDEVFHRWVKDSEVKVKTVAPGIVLMCAGNGKRKKELN
ncbi:hypothetical protein CASFOL_039485 [Castilleja foliolosa]|uniref:Uncharacterized protein n=1 Tax=Castilleja foliolosa TaxID=1961234 RepID=A0ABD3BI29_9LAMI